MNYTPSPFGLALRASEPEVQAAYHTLYDAANKAATKRFHDLAMQTHADVPEDDFNRFSDEPLGA